VSEIVRCAWAVSSPEMTAYHDKEWGVPVHDDRVLFEFIVLEGMQAGLSWSTVLNRRPSFRVALDDYDIERIAAYDEAEHERLMANRGIIRHTAKVRAVKQNAQAFIKVQEEFGSFDQYLWDFAGGTPLQNNFPTLADLPVKTDLSVKLGKDLVKRGFAFVGPTIVYAYMQAVGVVNDHTTDCFLHPCNCKK